VPTPSGAQVPMEMLADIRTQDGPPDIRTENGQLVGFVFIDVTTTDIDGYVRRASERLSETMHFPQGCSLQWVGQFQYLREAEQRLLLVVPFTLLLIVVLIYMNTGSAIKTCIVL